MPVRLRRPHLLAGLSLALLPALAAPGRAQADPIPASRIHVQSAVTKDETGAWLTACGAARLLDDPDPHPAGRCQVLGGEPPDPPPQRVPVCRTNDHFGASVALGGDFDGDGRPDLAVGGTQRSGRVDAATSVWVLPGDGGRPLLVLDGNGRSDQFGASLAFLPDVDGDGRDELLIGAPASGLTGRVYLVRGRPDQAGARLPAREAATLLLQGSVPGARFGATLSVLDFDGDGRDELAVGAPGGEAGDALGWPGAVSLFDSTTLASGRPRQARLLDSSQAWRQLPGELAGSRFGLALASIGAVAGAGPKNLAVGAPGTRNEALDRLSAAQAGTLLVYAATDKSPLWRREQPQGWAFGWRLSGGRDLDADGRTDLAIGAPLWSPGEEADDEQPLGAVFLVSGADGHPLRETLDDTPALTGSGRFGGSISLCTDLTGDGLPDLLVGSPLGNTPSRACSRHGSFHAQGGPAAGLVTLIDGSSGEVCLHLIGESGRDRFGWSLAAGDLDGDGVPEILAGALGWSPPGKAPGKTLLKEVGRAYLFEGRGLVQP